MKPHYRNPIGTNVSLCCFSDFLLDPAYWKIDESKRGRQGGLNGGLRSLAID